MFLLFGRGACFFFAVWAGGVFCFLLFGRGHVLFLLFGRGRVLFFAVWAGGVFFFAVWAGDGSSFTYPSAWLVFKRPNNKRDRTAKKKTRVPWSWKALHAVVYRACWSCNIPLLQVVPWKRNELLELGVRTRLKYEHGVSNVRTG